jgi:Protein of unknown function (DUF4242)
LPGFASAPNVLIIRVILYFGARAKFSSQFQAHFKTPATHFAILSLGIPSASAGRRSGTPNTENRRRNRVMPKFVIEREIPGAGNLSASDLKAISRKSCGVLSSLGPKVQWVQSYVTADRIYCIYHAEDESLVRRHAELGGFPANKISRVFSVIDPATAE